MDVENKLRLPGDQGGGINWETGIGHTHTTIYRMDN